MMLEDLPNAFSNLRTRRTRTVEFPEGETEGGGQWKIDRPGVSSGVGVQIEVSFLVHLCLLS